jgi:hypothetical protein
MSNRDNFPPKIRRAVALRASYRCSFTGCGKPTVGPSDESSTAVALIGVAAHICAAAPGGKRHAALMSAVERSSIENAIWLCADHARLIDCDDRAFTVAALQEMKRDHEKRCASELRAQSSSSTPDAGLFAIGPDVVCLGDMVGINESEWRIRIEHFVIGGLGKLVTFIDHFGQTSAADRYVLSDGLGDGRVLAASPSLVKSEPSCIAFCPVRKRIPRIRAADLPTDLALSTNNDLVVERGDLAVVSGLASLPQKIRTCLSVQRGEMAFYGDFGTRLAEYYGLLRGSPWFEHLFKLEVIRQSAIPYSDVIMKRESTPLQCVEHVWGIEILAEEPQNQWLPIRLDLEVNGVGRWQCEIPVFLPSSTE